MDKKVTPNKPPRLRKVVLGAGISGLVTASILADRNKDGLDEVLVLDEFTDPGGNHISVDLNGYTFDIGSFFFADRSPFIRRFPEILPLYENHDPGIYRITRITPGYALARYPYDFRLDLLKGNPLLHVLSLIWGRLTEKEGASAAEYARYWIGNRFYQKTGLDSYMARFYGIDPALIEGTFAKKRMYWIENNASLKMVSKRFLNRKKVAPDAAPRQLVRPREGFARLYGTVQRLLEAQGVEFRLGVQLQSVTGTKETGFTITFDNGDSILADEVISTIPVNRLMELYGQPPEPAVRTLNLTSLFISFEGKRGFKENVVYNFAKDGAWKRLTMHSDFYGKINGRDYFSVEITTDGTDIDAEALFEDFISVTRRAGLFDGDIRLEGHRLTESAYPVYTEGATAASERILDDFEKIGISSFGRQGGFDYQPIAADSTRKAEEVMANRPDTVAAENPDG
ncbi:FAD-dependent oxidoreductase [Pseudooceanicola sp. C21-150M6]|uniref:FAD-dependent oxidoreductase n=1 Tax=Pseudooceanicola sp. C21-150M6 TaxID=3434355 RepID=UPI003D7F6933